MNINEGITNWWLNNARIKHGHPPESPVTIPMQEAPPMQSTSETSTWKKWVLPTLATMALGVGGAAVTNWWLGDEKPAEPQPTTEQSGSLYQYLEDGGYHL